ncbi:MAG: metal-dependent hydrolase [Planctomycetota bacterium]
MPSPFAHSAILMLLDPAARRIGLRPEPRWRRVTLLALLLVALTLPDIDFLIGLVFPGTALGTHAAGMHSLAMGLVGALVLTGLGTWLCRVPPGRLLVLMTAAIGLHLLMDMVSWGGPGIALFWPMTQTRVRLPLSVFYGVRHSRPGALHLHAVTLVSELLFVGLVWLVAKRLKTGTIEPPPETTSA